MIDLYPHITFNGHCREALEFYLECFGGEVTLRTTYAEASMDVPEAYKDGILFAAFSSQGVIFFASDGIPGQFANSGENIALNIDCTDPHEQRNIYEKLLRNGTQIVPLAEIPGNMIFGIVRDRFGIQWMFRYFL